MMKGDSSPHGLLTARGATGAIAPAFAIVSRLFPESRCCTCDLPENTNGHPGTWSRMAVLCRRSTCAPIPISSILERIAGTPRPVAPRLPTYRLLPGGGDTTPMNRDAGTGESHGNPHIGTTPSPGQPEPR